MFNASLLLYKKRFRLLVLTFQLLNLRSEQKYFKIQKCNTLKENIIILIKIKEF